jgi:RNA polymerase II subunit A small phosphatase-like protein
MLESEESSESLVSKSEVLKVDSSNGVSSVDVSSVITQVTSITPHQAPATHKEAFETSQETAKSKTTWGKVRQFFCCFAPATRDRYEHHVTEAEAEELSPDEPLIPIPPRIFTEPVIGPIPKDCEGLQTLVLDLDETLVHSSFKPIPNPDYIIPVEIEGRLVDVYVLKRPYMDQFMQAIAGKFEVIVFTASLSKYADPLLDLMDPQNIVQWRLFRESCCPYEGNYVKDLTCLGRDLAKTIIVDNSPHSYVFQPYNALPIGTFIDDMEDQELLDMVPMLLKIADVEDVRHVLGANLAKLL